MAALSARRQRNQIGYNGSNGVAVRRSSPARPADQAGIQPGDVIQKIDGKDVTRRQVTS